MLAHIVPACSSLGARQDLEETELLLSGQRALMFLPSPRSGGPRGSRASHPTKRPQGVPYFAGSLGEVNMPITLVLLLQLLVKKQQQQQQHPRNKNQIESKVLQQEKHLKHMKPKSHSVYPNLNKKR